MNRPLALAGFSALTILLLALCVLPSAVLVPLAVLLLALAAVFALYSVLRRGSASLAPAVVMLAAALALFRLCMAEKSVTELQQLADERVHIAEGNIFATGNGLYEGVYSVEFRVDTLDGQSCRPFTVQCSNVENGTVGQRMRMQLEFERITGAFQKYQYGKGVYLRALQPQPGAEEVLGEGKGLLLAMTRLRTELGSRFLAMGRSFGGLAAAMVLGDRSRLDEGVQQQFRLAGVSHILVVSGMHLSLLSTALLAALYPLLFSLRLSRERSRRLSILFTMVVVLGYMLLAGLTPSVIRSGVMLLLALGATFSLRPADSLTGMGLALLILLAVNPYAACDLGLLLSFAATLGVLCFTTLYTRHMYVLKKYSFFKAKPVDYLLKAFGTTLFASLFTLPVLAVNGTAVSPGALLCNMFCAPLVLPIMVVGVIFLITHLITGLPQLLLSGQILYGLISLMEWMVSVTNRIFVDRVGVAGVMAAAVLCTAGVVTWLVYHSKLRRWCAAVGFGCLIMLWGSFALLTAGTVRVALVGTGINPSVVISRDKSSAVLFRGRISGLDDIQEYLAVHGLMEPELVVDLTDGDNAEMLLQSFGRVDHVIQQDTVYTETIECLDGIQLVLVRQKTGSLCYIGVDDMHIGVNSGPVDVSCYPACSVYLAGYSRAEGLRTDMIIRGENEPSWLEGLYSVSTVYTGEEPTVWLRPGISMRVLGAIRMSPNEIGSKGGQADVDG